MYTYYCQPTSNKVVVLILLKAFRVTIWPSASVDLAAEAYLAAELPWIVP